MFKSILVKSQTSEKETFKHKNRKVEKLIHNKNRGRPNSYVLTLINSPSLFEYVLHQNFRNSNIIQFG